MTSSLPKTLFLGVGNTGLCWYRAALPAIHLGQDWAGVSGEPPELVCRTGGPAPEVALRDLEAFEAVVVQQPKGPLWLQLVRRLQAAGVTVIYEIDDYLHGIRKQAGHTAAGHFDRDTVKAHELVMRACDGIICSTGFLAARYAGLNERIWICRNGIDTRRYVLSRPAHDGVAIGWAGAFDHAAALERWLPAIVDVMTRRPETRFVSVGYPFADTVAEHVDPERCLAIPVGMLETYPAAMTHIDVALAPSARTNFYRGKSDLRWLEASALGIPVVADPEVYDEIEPGVTGMHAVEPAEAGEALDALVADAALRERIGAAARAHVTAHRDMAVMAEQWRRVLNEATGRPLPAAEAA
jgi:glycosyltransferase involved in cell wall biosynthesis